MSTVILENQLSEFLGRKSQEPIATLIYKSISQKRKCCVINLHLK